MSISNKRLVVMPVYNEEKHVDGVIAAIRKYYKGDILAVDDGSSDGSAKKLSSVGGLLLIQQKANFGYGRSLIDGFRYALDNGYTQVITIDCDEQHEPHHIPEIFENIGNLDIYSASRYLQKMDGDDAPPADRYKINRIITEKLNHITGYKLTDGFCGMKGYRVESLRNMKLDENGYAFPLQFWVQAHCLSLTVSEFPIERIYQNLNRSFGEQLDNPKSRLSYYEEVLQRELERCQSSLQWASTPTT